MQYNGTWPGMQQTRAVDSQAAACAEFTAWSDGATMARIAALAGGSLTGAAHNLLQGTNDNCSRDCAHRGTGRRCFLGMDAAGLDIIGVIVDTRGASSCHAESPHLVPALLLLWEVWWSSRQAARTASLPAHGSNVRQAQRQTERQRSYGPARLVFLLISGWLLGGFAIAPVSRMVTGFG